MDVDIKSHYKATLLWLGPALFNMLVINIAKEKRPFVTRS